MILKFPMNMKKFIPASLAGGIFMWLLAGLWHGVIMARFYTAETHAAHEGTVIIFIAYMVLACLMAYLYPLLYKEGAPSVKGLWFGVIIGILWVFPHELAMAGAHSTSIAYVFKNAAWHIVEQGMGGVIIGFVYGKGGTAAKA